MSLFSEEDDLEGGLGIAALLDHLLELGPVSDAAALYLVHVLAGDEVVVLVGIVPERTKQCRHREVHILPVAGDPDVECRWGEVLP